MKLIAMINSCVQYSPDSFEDRPRILEITPETTIADIIKWHNQPKKNDDGRIGQIHILETEENQIIKRKD